MITEEEYKRLRSIYDHHIKWLEDNNIYSYKQEELDHPTLTNDEISQIEVYEWINDPPEYYFTYVDIDKRVITTWTGEKLGDIISKWQSGNIMGGFINLVVRGTNGKKYYGRFYPESGDYVKLKAYKEKK